MICWNFVIVPNATAIMNIVPIICLPMSISKENKYQYYKKEKEEKW
jgi:hypothetical protein